jgi:hypothetical protein
MQCLLFFFHYYNVYAKAPHRCVIHTLHFLLKLGNDFSHSCTEHLDTIKVFYLTTDAQ